ncbi:DUF3558 domain-containing protein [Nocardia sp. NPDC058640]|uniref:DUF3558 domain-containing protein n=1 Tax=Nocardia sp. NPDC058640 TaxID=3346571 RepID=UPI00365DE545
MNRLVRPKYVIVGPTLVMVAASLLGCGKTTDGGAVPTTSLSVNGRELAKEVPSGFDPCVDVPAQVLTEEKLGSKKPDLTEAPGGVVWKGCDWVYLGGGGYAMSVRMTNLTVAMVRDRKFPESNEFTVGGREAIAWRQEAGRSTKDVCDVNVAVRGGSMEINVVNPPSRRETGHLDSCDIARSLADKIAPSIPGSL